MISESRAQLDCPSRDIAAYLDGELTASEEMSLELHMAACRTCSEAFNSQKILLNDLEHSLRNEPQIDLPANFAKVVVANAENRVSGVRRWNELVNAAFVSVALLIFALFVVGPSGRVVIDQLFAVVNFFGHLIYSFVLGLTIILRNVASQFPADRLLTTAVVLLSFGVLVLASRRRLWIRRA